MDENTLRNLLIAVVQNNSAILNPPTDICSVARVFTTDTNLPITIFCIVYFVFWIFLFGVGGYFYTRRVIGKNQTTGGSREEIPLTSLKV